MMLKPRETRSSLVAFPRYRPRSTPKQQRTPPQGTKASANQVTASRHGVQRALNSPTLFSIDTSPTTAHTNTKFPLFRNHRKQCFVSDLFIIAVRVELKENVVAWAKRNKSNTTGYVLSYNWVRYTLQEARISCKSNIWLYAKQQIRYSGLSGAVYMSEFMEK